VARVIFKLSLTCAVPKNLHKVTQNSTAWVEA